MGYPPQPPHDPNQPPYGQQPYQPQPYSQPHMSPSGPQYGPVQTMVVKQWGFNPVALAVHLCLWIFLHWWMTVITIGFWLLVAIPVSIIGWRVKRVVPVQQVQRPPYPPQIGH